MKNLRPHFIYSIPVLLLVSCLLTPDLAYSKDQLAGGAGTAANTHLKQTAKAAGKKSKEDQAIDLVWRRSEVKKWLKLFPHGTSKLGGHAAASADHAQGDVYSVHVYEDLPDHTATLNWFDVNIKTGKITKKF